MPKLCEKEKGNLKFFNLRKIKKLYHKFFFEIFRIFFGFLDQRVLCQVRMNFETESRQACDDYEINTGIVTVFAHFGHLFYNVAVILLDTTAVNQLII